MKQLFTTLSLLAIAAACHAQTTAANFTATDCKGKSHTLYTELEAGKTVAMVWVMPCMACDAATKATFKAIKDYETGHPGRTLYYLISDYGDDDCATLEAYATSMGVDVSKIAVFDNAGKVIDQANYGGNGMPHVVIASGTDHKIWFNEKDGTGAGVADALNKATSVGDVAAINFSMSPNPVTNSLEIRYKYAIAKVTIMSLNGQVVKDIDYKGGEMNPTISLPRMPAATYIVQIKDVNGRSGIQQIVKE